MIGAICSYLIGRKNKKARDYFANFVTIVEFLVAASAILILNGHGGHEVAEAVHDAHDAHGGHGIQ